MDNQIVKAFGHENFRVDQSFAEKVQDQEGSRNQQVGGIKSIDKIGRNRLRSQDFGV